MSIRDKIRNYIHEFKDNLEADYELSEENEVKLDIKEIAKFNTELGDLFEKDPTEFIKKFKEEFKECNVTPNNPPNYLKTSLEDIRPKHIGRMVVVEGDVRRRSKMNAQVVSITYRCKNCGKEIDWKQSGKKLEKPYKCQCGSRKFQTVDRNYRPVANMRMEAPVKESSSPVPQSMSVEFGDHLTTPDKYKLFRPGDRVKIVGVVRPSRIKKTRRFNFYLQALNISPVREEFEKIQVTEEDKKKIKELSQRTDVFGRLTNSIAPEIHGRDDIKKATVLQLFGGVERGDIDRGNFHRGDIHTLLIGDPGTAKSKILSFISGIAPKSRYLSSGSVTSSGLTSTAVKDDDTWTLEAGSLALTNKGVLCLDEIDALDNSELKRLNEAMERQTISVSKASVNSTLETKTTVLAAGNPSFERFDPFQPIAEQIDIPDTLLSRFDLVFPLKDEPNPEKDEGVIDNVFGETEEDIDLKLMKKYIAYAKREIRPEITEEAKQKIKDYYLKIRGKSSELDGEVTVPITARQIHSIRRLAEASARMRLSDEVKEQDAQVAISLVNSYLEKVGFDPESGEWDIDQAEGRSSATQRSKRKKILHIVDELEQDMEDIPKEDVIAQAEGQGVTNAEDIIEKLKTQGELFEPKQGHIKKL